ncbi:MAG: phosphoglucosamine mutase [Candidatus Bathyarchaeota archaeon]|jgi:phosphomannomutase/phosphoglucomutase|nr:phosphoglucosamine mutase [Candidatus Bathyarchaeota archaeon]MCW3991634.1 phosphoglucosamine mutase [Candidatus Bathyarchaeota archaeon]
MGRLFGTNGVRGVVNKELTVDKVVRLAASVGAYLGGDIALGQDGRTSSPMFRDAAVCGLLSVGCNVHDVGLLPTPALQFSVKNFGLDGGLMVTASHNPPEFNGVKVMAPDGVEVSRQQELEIEESFFSGGPEPSPWDRIGKIGKLEVLDSYKTSVLTHVDLGAVQEAGLKVAIDPGNGVAALTAPDIAVELGCDVFTINVDVDGRFPGRESEPRPDNLGDLSALVRASGADVGVAFDGDGDRSLFVDERGEVHWGDRSVALVARDFMEKNPGAEVATPVSSSRVIEDVVEAGGGRVIWTEVGSVVVSRTMVDKGLKLGGEGNGGIMYGPHLEVRDGSMALALILGIMARSGKPLSELFAELPQYSQMKDRVSCPEEVKDRVLEALMGSVDAPSVETIDGVKLGYPDGSWILIRPSGTEPIFRLYAEAVSPERVEELIGEHKELVESVIASLGR